ncbi:MAG: hypothetical protein Q4Q28_09180 [Bacteroidales bacterium]|nr:hypothetical protein [Bacteroidales bacterium]
MEKGRAEGLEKGRTEGERSKSIEIAKKMKAMRLDDATIMQATGLSASDIADLLNK